MPSFCIQSTRPQQQLGKVLSVVFSPELRERKKKSSLGGRKIQIFLKARRSARTEVVWGMEGDAVKEVPGIDKEDVHATCGGREVQLR